MKKYFFFLLAIFLVGNLYAQLVPRNMVVLEIGTGTWCVYCPGAAQAADQMVLEGKSVAVIEYHNGDPFTNNASNARNSYYGITGYPTANFDGVLTHVGGQSCPNFNNVTTAYNNYYNQRIAVQSPMTIDISGSNSGNVYNIVLSIKKTSTITATDLKAHLVLTESNLAATWFCLTDCDFTERTMVPNENGTSVSFASGDMQIINLTFTKDPTWNAANCELVAFVQSNGSREIYQGAKVALNALPPPLNVNFTGTPTTFCAPGTVNFTDQTVGATNWRWEFQGGNPATSTLQNPAVSYTTTGNYDVKLTAWTNTRGNSMTKPAYINPTATPSAPGTPAGSSELCVNPANQSYSTTGATGATSYTWDLQPAASGVLTPNGTSCIIDWNNTFTGAATLKVSATNSCGTGPYSTPLTININPIPGQAATPTGPTLVCQSDPSSTYTTTGATNATDYTWELSPTSAGSLSYLGTEATVYWSGTFTGSVTLKVQGFAGNCVGVWSNPLNITVSANPQAFDMTGGGVYCIGGNGIEVGLSGSASGVNYTLILNGNTTSTVVPGNGNAISFGLQTQVGTYASTGQNPTTTCTTTMNGAANVSTTEAPGVPGQASGPTTIYSLSTPSTDYSTTGGLNAESYEWMIEPTTAGTVAGTGVIGTVTWDPAFLGTASIKVRSVNACGESDFSTPLDVTVFNTVGIGENQSGSVRIYPNPAREAVSIVTPVSGNYNIRIFCSIGEEVMKADDLFIQGTYSLDISMLKPGIYTLQLRQEGKTHKVRLVVM